MAILSDLLTLAFLPAWAKGALVVLLAYNIQSAPARPACCCPF